MISANVTKVFDMRTKWSKNVTIRSLLIKIKSLLKAVGILFSNILITVGLTISSIE